MGLALLLCVVMGSDVHGGMTIKEKGPRISMQSLHRQPRRRHANQQQMLVEPAFQGKDMTAASLSELEKQAITSMR